jgi:hypothetical protein
MSTPAEAASFTAVITSHAPTAVKLAAVETLLADPESLQDDVLKSALYMLRERLQQA